ncbi:MAG: acetate kinase, partial [Candidatus Omnitrophica bacterium]|nr:acetate kinase [Candidatus Omnitrophota bacterium]
VKAREALDIYLYRLRKYIGAYTAILGRVDGIVFTGGVGEKSAEIREDVLTGLDSLGIKLDLNLNAEGGDQPCFINGQNSVVKLMVIPTNEELHIARQVKKLLAS